eukprot:CAMPEP_0197631622 /NCGR_PEP_ID=MMETSP1338-20131121/8732_1 /TAXON_ID=43686 ORGANISM="Pelagodinium beii, Strain RCC1491" /NCGR_SAMPLE_ID=MMETSP1338 /ASSEMBLY_ACC=CAM_ASM_000754 /LENGTH=155 /DNA_ID=CAMNT_0043203123 /DNA_START=25 /DNA_END=489 /DNA_ORIENTATION=+
MALPIGLSTPQSRMALERLSRQEEQYLHRQHGITRVGEEEFQRRYSASARSLFNRGGPNSVLDEDSQASHHPGGISWSISMMRSRANTSRGAEQLQNRSNLVAGSAAIHTANSKVTRLRSCPNETAPRVGNCIQSCGVCQTHQPMDVLIPCGHLI